jgi:hypothetical protein
MSKPVHPNCKLPSTKKLSGLEVASAVKAGTMPRNHNVRAMQTPRGLRIKSAVKAGDMPRNHNRQVLFR